MNKVLIVEDDMDIQFILDHLLSSEGYVTTGLDCGEKLFETVSDFKPDLILMDVWLRGDNGKDLCKALKSHPDTRHLPIIMMSATSEEHADYAGCNNDDVLEKPFEIDVLLGKVSKHILK